MTDFEAILAEKDYLIKAVISSLQIYDNFREFYHIGTIELYEALSAYKPELDEHKNFEVYAYYRILNRLKNELRSINRHQKLEMLVDLYQNEYLAPIIEDDLMGLVDCDYIYKSLSDKEKQLIEYRKNGYQIQEIAKIFNVSRHQVYYMSKCIAQKIKDIIRHINVN